MDAGRRARGSSAPCPPGAGRVAAALALLLITVAGGGFAACADDGRNDEDAGARASTPADPPVVRVDGGRVGGVRRSSVWAYLGVPYAAPPVGDLRWRPPERVADWKDVRACDRYGPSCPQAGGIFGGGGSQSEDCLSLNVWTPPGEQGRRLPVMVFIHGGSFLSGSGSMYDGSSLAAHDVVVVTINYRLGPFGFFAHPLLTAESPHGSSGNYGLLDQRAALEWVRRNIAEFGGDPAAVTVFGESAGGASVVDHLVSPGSDGLFAQAIVQSAPYIDDGIVIYSTRPLAVAERLGADLSRQLGCADAPDELEALRDVPAERLLEVGDPGDDIFPTGITYQPVVDGWVLPDVPVDLLADGRFSRVPLVVGSTRDEADIAAIGTGPADLDAAEAQRALRRIYGEHFDAIMGLFSSSAGQDGGGDGEGTGAEGDAGDAEDEALRAAVESVTLTLFTAPARYAADRMAATGTPTYRYLFTAAPLGDGLGAFHGSELPYVFGSDMLNLDLTGDRSAELSAAMMRYWTTFAADGDPNGGDLPDWPRWSPDTQPTQELGWAIRTIERYQDHQCDVAERLFVPGP